MDFSYNTPNTQISTLATRKHTDPRFSSESEKQQLIRIIAKQAGVNPRVAEEFLYRHTHGKMLTPRLLSELLKDYAQKRAGQGPKTGETKPEDLGNLNKQLQKVWQVKSEIKSPKAGLDAEPRAAQRPSSNLLNTEEVQALYTRLSPLLAGTVTSPRAFASLIVNNPGLFVLLRSNPQLFSLILGLNNPNLQLNPGLFAELAKILAMIIRLKQGKSTYGADEDEQIKDDRAQSDVLDATDAENALVKNIKGAINEMPIPVLRDFLLEAERFAEEELANIWSITMKKEKELEKTLGNIPDELRQLMKAFPHLEPKHLLEKFKKMKSKNRDVGRVTRRMQGKFRH